MRGPGCYSDRVWGEYAQASVPESGMAAAPRAPGAVELGEEGAAAVAALAALARGEGAPGTSAAECRVVTPGSMADLHGVRNLRFHAVLRPRFVLGRWWDADVASWTERLSLKHAKRHGGSSAVDSAMDG